MTRERRRLVVLSRGIRALGTIECLLSDFDVYYGRPKRPRPNDVVLAWGRRPSAIKAEKYARMHGLKTVFAEDGFIRSVGLGASEPPLSIVLDGLGLYLDANVATDLEICIAAVRNREELQRADNLVALWRSTGASKYNYQRLAGEHMKEYVLVVDQTLGDASISSGLANEQTFAQMLNCAIQENPHSKIVIKVHPEVVAGRKKGHFDLALLSTNPRLAIVANDVHPASLIRDARTVYVVTSQIGFEALIWGKSVRVFGMPFYAGWGLTSDELPRPERRGSVSFGQLVYGALIAYPRYFHPENMVRCEVEDVVGWIGCQRKFRNRFPPKVLAYRFSKWKQTFIKDFFNGSNVEFIRDENKIKSGDTVAVWGRNHDLCLSNLKLDLSPIRIEDGFLRSVGLGAHLVRPLSWVQDQSGIYYDSTSASDLETILRTDSFGEALLSRSKSLIAAILEKNLTKYNVSDSVKWSRNADSRKVILVPGQVESDASLKFGGGAIRRNIELLQVVRDSHPQAFIIYKPHPDVAAKLRKAGDGEYDARKLCDALVIGTGMHDLLESVDEVHTMTSLTGFEALLRGVKVTTYGRPFYAGWNLTEDRDMSADVLARRGRALSVEALAAATLILYPTYISRVTGKFTTPERAIEELSAWRDEGPPVPWYKRKIAEMLQKF